MISVREEGALAVLTKGLVSLNLTPSDEQMRCFSAYLSELKKWNKAFSLTGIRTDRDIAVKHFLDSLLYLRAVPDDSARVADVGSGAGFPGIPIKIIRRGLKVFLIEPSVKKAAFLRHMIRLLKFERIQVIECRIEELRMPEELSEPVDVALTRALFDVKEFVRKTARIVKPGGVFILNKGPKAAAELGKAGDLQCELLKIPLPQSDIVRTIIVVQREKPASF